MWSNTEIILMLAPAVVLDIACGDPPNGLHPVAWLGKVASLLEKGGYRLRPAMQFLYGLMLTLFVMALFAVPAYYIIVNLNRLSTVAAVFTAILLLKCTFSIQGLRRAALRVKKPLAAGKLDEARFELHALVGRDTANLSEPLVASAAVESVAENAGDSLVAPLFYCLLFGLPGAMAYRAVNTLDAMIGYHGKYEYLGKFAARLDDVLNYLPARITALLLVLAAFIMRRDGRNAWRTATNEHARTESPNAGWTMASMAGALNVKLEKVGHYRLGEGNKEPTVEDIDTSIKLFLVVAAIWVIICLITGVIGYAFTT